jgi:hypothetical protein
MIHSDRVFSVKKIDNEQDLVSVMSEHKWPLCISFHYGDLLYVNDSDSEDDPEYAVMTVDRAEGHHDVHGREVGRIWSRRADKETLRKFIQDMSSGRWSMENQVNVRAEPVWHHSCELCRLEE